MELNGFENGPRDPLPSRACGAGPSLSRKRERGRIAWLASSYLPSRAKTQREPPGGTLANRSSPEKSE
jgi:hypothetical protein